MFTEAYVRELRDEARRYRVRVRLLERALIRVTLAARAGIDDAALPEAIIAALSVDLDCHVRGIDAVLPSLPSA